jgi:glycosyltransferase involved in cell wall biosynthesis
MRIALNAWFYDQPNTGSGQYTRNLVNALREVSSTIDIQLVTPGVRTDIGKVWFEQIEFPRAASRMGADIAFVPYWAPPLRCRVPVAVTVHDVIPIALPEYRGGPMLRLYSSLVRASSASATALLTDSEHSRSDIVRLLPVKESAVTSIPLAAESRYTPVISSDEMERVRERYDLPDTYVFYLGSFDRRKNIETLLQLYGWCVDTIGEQFPLLITGDASTPVFSREGRAMTLGNMLHELQLTGEEVRLIGRVPEEDKPALYSGARCFIFTSIYEGFGLPVLEAMACGTPVVGSNASSIPEVVGNAGILVEPYDARRMAGAVIAICTEDSLHDRLSQRALLRASQFSWQRTALETLVVFNRISASR